MDERGKSVSSYEFYPEEDAHAPATPAKPGQPDLNLTCNNWLENPFDEALFEEMPVKKSFSSWETNLGSTSQNHDFGQINNNFSMNDAVTWENMSFRDLLARADAGFRKFSGDSGSSSGGGGGATETQQYGWLYPINNLCDLNAPPETVTEPLVNTRLSLQFAPVTPDHVKRAEHMASGLVISNEAERVNLAAENIERFNLDEQSQAGVSTLVEANQDFEKGLTEQTDLNETPQLKEKRRKHRPKVVTEGKPKRARKPATPKPETPKSTTGKRKYVRRKGVQKPTETPTMVEGSEPVDPSPDQQTKKSCKRKINFDESEQETEVVVEKTLINLTVDKTCSGSQEAETCQKINETQSASPITPSKTELPQGRSRKDYTKAKCRINFSQETHDKGQSIVPSPNESRCSTSACFNKGELSSEIDEIKLLHENTLESHRESLEAYLSIYTDWKQGMTLPVINKKKKVQKNQGDMTTATNVGMQLSGQNSKNKGQSSVPSPNESRSSTSACFNKGELSSEIDGFKLFHENTLESHRESLEAYLSIYTDWKQGMPLPVINKTKKVEKNQGVMTTATNISMQISGPNSKSKKDKALTVYDSVSFAGIIDGRHQQHTYMKSHAADFQASIATKKKTKKKSMVPSSYHDHQRFTNQIGHHPSLRYKSIYDINELINQFERLHINSDAVVPYLSGHHEKNALVVYQRDGSLVPYEGLFNPLKKRKPRAKVDLDDETNRVWMLLLEDINSEGIDGTDEAKAKWWEEERRVFRGRADSFIARMHLVQGDRRFSRWKGSVLDSVVGVFLTQNVSDHLSSSAFMSLAARYPLKPNSSNEHLPEEESVLSVKEPCQVDESAGHGPMILQEADSYEEKETVNSNEFSKKAVSSIDLNDNSECEIAEFSERELIIYNEAVIDQIEVNEIVSSQNSADRSPGSAQSSIANTTERLNSCSMHNSEKEQKEGSKPTTPDECTSFVELLHMQGPTTVNGSKIIQKNSGTCTSEESGISAEFASQTTVQMVKATSSQESAKSCNNCEVQEVFNITNVTTEAYRARESNKIVEASGKMVQKVTKEKTGKKEIKVEWDKLRLQAEVKQKRERTPYTMDSLDYEAVRTADVSEVADAIKERGMNNVLAGRIKDVLDRLVREHGSMDLEWLRDVPPDKAKEYLLSFRGLGLKSVECIRLLTLHHLAFPVDTNVGRIAVRLGWVPLQPLPESLQLHLLELYPVLESIQKYLWPRLCKLDQRTLYELHYQMITFGKVFCTKTKPNCNACPLRGECRHFASAFTSARLSLPAPAENIASLTENRAGQNPIGMIDLPPPNELKPLSEVQNCSPVIEEPVTPGPIVEVPTTAGPIVEVPATPEPIVEVPASPEPEQIQQVFDIEDFCEGTEEIPMIKLNIEEFTQNLQTYMERHMELGEGDMSKALVALTPEAASIPTPKLKNVSQLRTEHQVYELPDSHPLLEGLDTREPDDPCSYLLAIWTPGETADSIQPPEGQCSSQESGILCNEETCFFCNSTREANSQTVRGTILIPCRTAMRGSFPLNGTYFQVNEVFADHESSLNPIDVPRAWLWNLPRRTVYFGTSIPTIFKGLTTEDIQYCFWRGFVCVRGFDQKTRAPRPLMARFHFPASKLKKTKAKD